MGGETTVDSLSYEIDVNTLHRRDSDELALNAIGRCSMSLAEPIAFDGYRGNRQTGAFVLIDRLSNNTVGAGMIVVPALLGYGLTGGALVGTDAVLGLAVIIAKTVTFGSLDILTGNLVSFGLMVGIASAPGIYIARFILDRTSVKVHVAIVEVMIVVGALSILYRGLVE